MTKRERIALLSVLLALVLAVLWILWMTTGCGPTEPTENIDRLSSETQKTDGGGESRDAGGGIEPGNKEARYATRPAAPLEQPSYYPMRLTHPPIVLAAQAPPHACQPGIFGVCMTCLANKQRRAMQDTTGTYAWTYATFNPMPMFGQRNRNQK